VLISFINITKPITQVLTSVFFCHKNAVDFYHLCGESGNICIGGKAVVPKKAKAEII
jgi:hypothetical protein